MKKLLISEKCTKTGLQILYRQLSQLSETVKGVDSHGNCKTHYKDPVIASAYKSDNRTTGGHVHYMAVRNCISYPVRDYLYHSYIRVWIRAGN